MDCSPVAEQLNVAVSGNKRFLAFLSTLDHVVKESIGCNDDSLLEFSKFKMAAKMAPKSHYWL